MAFWLRVAGYLDVTTGAVARAARWALLANALLVAGNAIGRKLFSASAPVIYDLQFHFFAAVGLLTAAYTFQRDEHVRVDVLAQRLGERGMAWLDLTGIALVLLPICLLTVWITTPPEAGSIQINVPSLETDANSAGRPATPKARE